MATRSAIQLVTASVEPGSSARYATSAEITRATALRWSWRPWPRVERRADRLGAGPPPSAASAGRRGEAAARRGPDDAGRGWHDRVRRPLGPQEKDQADRGLPSRRSPGVVPGRAILGGGDELVAVVPVLGHRRRAARCRGHRRRAALQRTHADQLHQCGGRFAGLRRSRSTRFARHGWRRPSSATGRHGLSWSTLRRPW
jgi:hypothetical protein